MDGGVNESMLKSFFKSKWVITILLLNIVIIIVVITLLIINSSKNSKLVFSVTPLDATISVNGDTNFTNGTNTIYPGKYDIVISRDGLETKSFSADVLSDQTVTISTFLVDTEKTFDFYKLTENVSSMEKPEDVRKAENSQPDPVSVDWDLSGSLVECLKRYARSFSNEKREFLLQCLEEGLSERQIKRLIPLRTMEEMKLYRRIFLRRSS